MKEDYSHSLFLEREPNGKFDLYFRDHAQVLDLSYLDSIGLTTIAGHPEAKIKEAAKAQGRSVQLISELLKIGSHVSW